MWSDGHTGKQPSADTEPADHQQSACVLFDGWQFVSRALMATGARTSNLVPQLTTQRKYLLVEMTSRTAIGGVTEPQWVLG